MAGEASFAGTARMTEFGQSLGEMGQEVAACTDPALEVLEVVMVEQEQAQVQVWFEAV